MVGSMVNRDTKKGLANNLSKEAGTTRYGVQIHDDIRTLLQSLSASAPQTNAEFFASQLDPYVRPSIETAADAVHFRLGERTVKRSRSSPPEHLIVRLWASRLSS